MAWSGNIALPDGIEIKDIIITSQNGAQKHGLSERGSLRFKSIVELPRVPLHLITGPPYSVHSSNPEAERWFQSILVSDAPEESGRRWWEAAASESPLGILVGVEGTESATKCASPRVTEVLFYASRDEISLNQQPTPPPSSPLPGNGALDETAIAPKLRVHAVALSSDLLYSAQGHEPTPPTSPVVDDAEILGTFLPSPQLEQLEIINEPPVRKRRNAVDVFDEASERRKKARRKGGVGVSAAAATINPESQGPVLKHHRSGSSVQPTPLHTRPLSRSPSVSSSRPPTAAGTEARRSTLSRVQSAADANDEPTTESKNKDLISRIVMAGMRLYGLSRSKDRKSRTNSTIPSPSVDASFEEGLETEQKNDEDYKLIYHQAFKATCFTFRASIAKLSLQPSSEVVRDVADKLLAVFCGDPLAELAEDDNKWTPGGRQVFGSAVSKNDKSPFSVGRSTRAVL